MAKFESKIINDKKTWEDFVLSRSPKSFLQSWDWGETQELIGNKVFRLGFYSRNELVGACQLIKEKAKRGTYLLIPGGPFINWDDPEFISFFAEEIKRMGKSEKALFIRIRPEILSTQENKNLFRRLGFISAPMHLNAENTWVLNIDKSEEEILAGMRKTTRYLVKKSLKFNLNLEITKEGSASKILSNLQRETVERHKFIGFSEKLFQAQISTFCKDDQGAVFIVRKDNVPLAAAIIIFYADTAYYHHSGSTSSDKEIPFSYFLQWQIIKEAKRRGCKYYNFWGIAPNDNPKHRFAGVTIFKTGFGGARIDWLHAHDLPLSIIYPAEFLFETLRRIIRRL